MCKKGDSHFGKYECKFKGRWNLMNSIAQCNGTDENGRNCRQKRD